MTVKKTIDKQKIIQGIECCLGIDSRRCEGCPYKRNGAVIDGRCAERMMRQALEAVRETMTEVLR